MRYTFKQFQSEFPNDAACLERVLTIRFGGTEIDCQKCGVVKAKHHPMNKRRGFACQECGNHIFPCAGTIFEKSSTPLTTWFFAMYLMTSTRHGVAAKEVQRQTGVTYKTAWRICHELRKLMASADYRGMLGNEETVVEIDETYVGGVQKNRKIKNAKNKLVNKSIVFGMVERDGGKVRTGVIENTHAPTMQRIVYDNVNPETTISTDEHRSYLGLRKHYKHGVVKHGMGEYVRGEHHVNTMEGHWSHLKRSIKGTHISVSGKHLWKYVAEFNFRRNFRVSHYAMFTRLISAFGQPRLVER